ncbi:hypothetical protein F5148DRAFT_453407 [Russula earlei]|uniref:Uncharacterized protein n=1 Tax=Russula earlei TaxID=71964 RepID=A0ACC0TYL5_9AGAM|nr:hypothetical protein F5148DRAFT_453407 [Russula earlei]
MAGEARQCGRTNRQLAGQVRVRVPGDASIVLKGRVWDMMAPHASLTLYDDMINASKRSSIPVGHHIRALLLLLLLSANKVSSLRRLHPHPSSDRRRSPFDASASLTCNTGSNSDLDDVWLWECSSSTVPVIRGTAAPRGTPGSEPQLAGDKCAALGCSVPRGNSNDVVVHCASQCVSVQRTIGSVRIRKNRGRPCIEATNEAKARWNCCR